MVKKIGGLMFLIGSIVMIVMAFMYRAEAPHVLMEVCAAVALVGVILTRSKGIWVWIIGVVLTFVGAKGFIANTTVNTVLKYGGSAVNLIAMFLIWKDSIKDAFAK